MPGAKILVVEDDAALLEGLRDMLELSGFQISTGRNGEEGLAVLTTGALPDLIISDIMMPRMDGYQFYAAVRAHPEWVNIPVIFLTAKGDKSDVRRGKLLGADDYVTKPFDEEDLLVAIRAKLNRRAQLEAAHQVEMSGLKRTILTTLNHEFRTPLTYISTYTDMLGETPDLRSDEFKDFLHGIQMGSDRLKRLVEDFITLVELQTGEAQQNYEQRRAPQTDLADVLLHIVDAHRARALNQSVDLRAEVPAALPPVLADREQLTSAVTRLLDNALKFSKKDGGRVTLRAEVTGGRLRLQISVTGIGIRAEELGRLFDIFHQIDRAKMEQQGSGSGLAIARGFMALHGGTLTADSALGVGSTFTIELPTTS